MPFKVSLKYKPTLPHQHQYPKKHEVRREFQHLIDRFFKCGLLFPCQSPCNYSVLPVLKPNGQNSRHSFQCILLCQIFIQCSPMYLGVLHGKHHRHKLYLVLNLIQHRILVLFASHENLPQAKFWEKNRTTDCK